MECIFDNLLSTASLSYDIPWRERLETIYAYEFERQIDLRSQTLVFYEDKRLSVGEFMVLAWFCHHYGEVVEEDNLKLESKIDEDQLECYKESLLSYGLLVYKGDIVDMDIDALERFFVKKEKRRLTTMTYDDVLEKLKVKTKSFLHGDSEANEYVPYVSTLLRHIPDSSFAKGMNTLMKEAGWSGLTIEAKGVLILLINYFLEHGAAPFDPDYPIEGYGSGVRELVCCGYAVIVPESGDTDNRTESFKDRSMISSKVARTVFRGNEGLVDYARLCRQGEFIKAQEIPEKVLFYNDTDAVQINLLSKVFGTRRFSGIEKRLRSRGRRSGVTCLLCGAPGTGKTELVKQLARKSGRDIIVADAARLNGGLWGDAEKNVRELFMNFRFVHAVSSKTPILLMNEADGILGKRTESKRALERSESVVQTLFLQEMERFEGILVATTNMGQLLDPAFERRFLFKINVHAPDQKQLRKIWKSHIPELTEEQTRDLSGRYQFTGGLIENIAMKWDIHYALNGKFPDWDDLLEYCEAELASLDTERIHVRGF